MAKALALTPDALSAPQVTPQAATPPRTTTAQASPKATVASAPTRSSLAKPDQVPLQLRIPKSEAKKIKVAAAQAELSISDLMLACFHAYMKNSKA